MKTTISVTQAAEELLDERGVPMHYKEITNRIITKCNLQGKTPYETVRSSIGSSPKFIRTAEGVYALSKWKRYKQARFAKEIAYEVMKSEGRPCSLFDLGTKILQERNFKGNTKVIAKNAIRHDPRFYIDEKSGLVQLTEWNNL